MTAELTAPLVHKSEEKRIVYGPVLIPNEPDSDGDVVTLEQIERVAHKFVEAYGNIDLQHTLQNVGKLLESYITPVDLSYGDLTVPKGSWMMGVRVTDDTTWERVQKGELTGFSIMGIPAAMKSQETPSQRTTLADLGEAWVVNAVSLVDEPAVPKAKWVVIKSRSAAKSIAGSYEHRREVIEEAFLKFFPEVHDRAYVHQLFDDHVIVVHYSHEGDQYVDVPYTFDPDTGDVAFGEPAPVDIREYIVPLREEEEEESPENTPEEAQKSDREPFWRRVGKALGILKDDAETPENEKEVEIDVTQEELKDIVAGLVQEAMTAAKEMEQEEAPEEEEETPEADSEETPEETPEEDPAPAEKTPEESPESPEETPEAEEEEEAPKEDEEKAQLKNAVKNLESQVEYLMKSRRSNRLFGQDTTTQVEKSAAPASDRDAFGRKIR